MTDEFADFVDTVLRLRDQVHFLILDGPEQDREYERAQSHFASLGFRIFDVRDGQYDHAIELFPLGSPDVSGSDGMRYDSPSVSGAGRLLIGVGRNIQHSFWRNLIEERVLYTGSASPPVSGISPRRLKISEAAPIAALITARDFEEFPGRYVTGCRRLHAV